MKALAILCVLSLSIFSKRTISSKVIFNASKQPYYRTPEFGYLNFVFHPNSKLEVENKQQFHAQNYEQCLVACASNMTCFSINFGKQPIFFYDGNPQYLCELLPTDKYNSSSKFQSPNPESNHYSIRSDCSKSPCLHNLPCIPNYHNNTYECVCPRPPYEGKHCKVCQKSHALGLEDGTIPNKAITASSFFGSGKEPWRGRLNNVPSQPNDVKRDVGTWIAKSRRQGEYLQIDLGQISAVTMVATQGRPMGYNQWVTSYTIQYSTDGIAWDFYFENNAKKIFQANSDRNTVQTNTLQNAIVARYVRIVVNSWAYHIALRAELYGCP
ncbi:EGF-like repeat and discoidin I-like domain-containing protein 3 [Actinia tenebrosa]|uniref:EGF-like repeat and discoidin I-like domain-containing protein 3 n=1 Tax=Actinia tenebrosa TaxID=6105 RepID=A0A6P8ILL0_ACTTE|nr:EGF-like repeat and discoidin I-like domain-containing protein 3 [Actinia tenebrosa]